MRFELLDAKKHDRENFNCGVNALNTYLQRFANQDQKWSLTKVYMLVEGDEIIGYYTLSAHSVLRNDLPADTKAGSYDEVPFLLLGRLAVDKRYQGMGFGDMLIVHAFKNTREAAEKIGILGIIVDAKDNKAASFYEGFGFRKLNAIRNRLVLPIGAMDF